MPELQFAPLSEFADVTMGQSPDAAACNTEERGLPFLQGCAEFGATHPDTNIYCAPPLRVAKSGSVLISVRAPVGTMNYADQDYCVGRGLGAFKAKPGLANTIFLKHAVELNSGYLHRRSQGSTFAAVSTTDVRSVPVPAFSPQIQGRIASILSCIDTAIEKTEALIAKHQQIKAGLIHDLFTRGVLPNGQLRPPRSEAPELYQETAMGWIPLDWALSRIGHAFDIQLGKMLNQAARGGGSSFPYLGNRSVQWNKVEVSALEEMDFSPTEREKFSLLPDDLLVCEGGEVGRTAIWANQLDNCYYQKAIHRLRAKGSLVHPRYMLHFMWRAKTAGLFENFTSQTSIAHLTQEKLAQIPMAVPVPDEQRRVFERLDAVDRLIERDEAVRLALQKQKLGLMQDLLTGRVPVPVPAEPAEAAA